VKENVITAVLREAARIDGSTQGLASRLHAPESTLLLWMEGRAQVPLRALLNSIYVIVEWELQTDEPHAGFAAETGAHDKLSVSMGQLAARCSRCDGTEFRAVGPGELRLTSRLACIACGEEVLHGTLITRLAKELIQHSRSMVARARRRAKEARHCIEEGRKVIEESLEKRQRK
jgi:hypothetical protein